MTTRREIVARIAATTGYPKTHVSKVVSELFEELTVVLVSEGRLELRGFGVWRTVDLAARTGRNPKTGEPVSIESSRHVRFKAGKRLRERLNSAPDANDDDDARES